MSMLQLSAVIARLLMYHTTCAPLRCSSGQCGEKITAVPAGRTVTPTTPWSVPGPREETHARDTCTPCDRSVNFLFYVLHALLESWMHTDSCQLCAESTTLFRRAKKINLVPGASRARFRCCLDARSEAPPPFFFAHQLAVALKKRGTCMFR